MKWVKNNTLWIAVATLAIVLDENSIAGYRVNVIVVFIYYIGIRWQTKKAIVWAFVIGFLLDSIALKLIGPNILSKGTLIFMAYFFQTGIFNLSPMLNAILCFAFTAVDNFIVYYSLTLFDIKPTDMLYAANLTFYQSIINSVIGYVVMRERDE